MASIPSHMVMAAGLGKLFRDDKLTSRFFIARMICAALPDLDVIGMWAGIPYNSLFGHRGFTHSIFFAVLLPFVVMALVFRTEQIRSSRYWAMWFYFFIATLSHPILDAMTTGGLGVAFFSPFCNTRYFFPIRPIKVSPIGVGAFISNRGLAVIKNEFIYVWLPSIAMMFVAGLVRRRK